MHPFRLVVFPAALSLLGGCAPGLSASEASDLRRRLDESQRTAQAALKKAEELEDRVFLLTDQIESQKIASTRKAGPISMAALPVVTLRPQVAADQHYDEPNDPSDGGSEEIEFRGAAGSSKPTRVRPMLSGDGSLTSTAPSSSSASRPKAKSAPSVPIEVPSSHDSLGVAAAPPISGAKREVVVPFPSPAPSPSVAAVADDAPKLYRTASAELRAGRHDEAAKLFRELIKRFPQHDYADNAQYWLGETFYDRKRYAEAATEFQVVLAQYPSGNKAPDAMLKLALCLAALGDHDKSTKMLRTLPATYPRTDAARIAEERLAAGAGKESR